MSAKTIMGWNKPRLRLWLLVFFLALTTPTTILIYQAYTQLKWEAFHHYRTQAEELASRIENQLLAVINTEEQRPFDDYRFINQAAGSKSNVIQRSPLSNTLDAGNPPGLIGYFQVDNDGQLSTPLLPRDEGSSALYGVSVSDLDKRLKIKRQVQTILSQNKLVREEREDRPHKKPQPSAATAATAPAGRAVAEDLSGKILSSTAADEKELQEEVSHPLERQQKDESDTYSQALFDQLGKSRQNNKTYEQKKQDSRGLGKVGELNLSETYITPEQARSDYQKKLKAKEKALQRNRELRLTKRQAQKSRPAPVVAAKPDSGLIINGIDKDESTIRIFESELDPFEAHMLDSGHFVLFRKVWRKDRRYIQGLLIDPKPLIDDIIKKNFYASTLSSMSNMILAYQDNVLSVISGVAEQRSYSRAKDLSGNLLYKTRLSAPLDDISLIFSINNLPAGPGGTVVTWSALILIIILISGFLVMYRLGLSQINLTRQQQDFVSAVSHELKTPLTSIRMYGEMLREGWASEEKKRTYYDYIHDESERLSRLINNVLQLARLTRNDIHADLQSISLSELVDGIRSKVSSQVERAGFHLQLDCPQELKAISIKVDSDFFAQVIINLVDNALKFSAKAENKRIAISCARQGDKSVVIAIRDYGPGIAKNQLKKIFKLFYRSENELTRETVGTGIGLALVNQLLLAMHGSIDVINLNPGAEFRISFKIDA